jgi:hypothetical protein
MSAFGGIVLQNSKMRRQQNFAVRPAEQVFGAPMPRKEPIEGRPLKIGSIM